MGLSRRDFLTRVGQAGGYGAAFIMMQSLGLMPMPQAEAQELKRVAGNGTRVVILGGGIAGLVSAYELGKAGYRCTVLEARERVGGRNWSIRRGAKVKFANGMEQTCNFEESHYFNAGPARLPSIHTTMLGYCRELGIPLEVEVNTSRGTLLQCDKMNNGVAVEQRQMVNDTRGHVSELLAKCINKGALDQDLTGDDKERMLAFLRQYGDLKSDYSFKGSERSGFKVYPGAGSQAPEAKDPLPMHALLDANLWQGLLAEDVIDWQATMFQPIGGMDRIPAAFEKKLGAVVRYGSEAKQIRQSPTGVTVAYLDRATGKMQSVSADYCICAMPFSVVKTIDADFSPDVKALISATSYDSGYKIAWESRRFWEQDYNIYGGLSYLRQTVDVVWYPSAQFFSQSGIIVGGYSIENGTPFGKLPNMQAKLDASRASIEKLHPGHSQELKNPVYINWGEIPYNYGSWIHGYGSEYEKTYQRIIYPDRRVYFAGDHTSHIIGWQEGAALSAYRTINQIGVAVQRGGSSAA
ncbi:MAG TPA: FAD-dependent oxidoreductase [Alloacidobacterium sp.]|nr:FAD-dependent oxidoreductase [Alloacidobacterium sp.]